MLLFDLFMLILIHLEVNKEIKSYFESGVKIANWSVMLFSTLISLIVFSGYILTRK